MSQTMADSGPNLSSQAQRETRRLRRLAWTISLATVFLSLDAHAQQQLRQPRDAPDDAHRRTVELGHFALPLLEDVLDVISLAHSSDHTSSEIAF